jgi:hypothetical protein
MIATDRKGREYKVGDIVQMCDFPILAKSMLNIPLEIVQIIPIEHCESGHNIVVKQGLHEIVKSHKTVKNINGHR